MNKKKFSVRLADQEYRELQTRLHTGRHAARVLNRARILLRAHDGESDAMIADEVGVCLATVFNTRRRYCLNGLQAVLNESPR